jgi:hypothetical protein
VVELEARHELLHSFPVLERRLALAKEVKNLQDFVAVEVAVAVAVDEVEDVSQKPRLLLGHQAEFHHLRSNTGVPLSVIRSLASRNHDSESRSAITATTCCTSCTSASPRFRRIFAAERPFLPPQLASSVA